MLSLSLIRGYSDYKRERKTVHHEKEEEEVEVKKWKSGNVAKKGEVGSRGQAEEL